MVFNNFIRINIKCRANLEAIAVKVVAAEPIAEEAVAMRPLL